MRVNLKYFEILEETLIAKLEWLSEEFEIMFARKNGKFTIKDKKVANDIIDYVLENAHVNDNFILLNLLIEEIDSLEKMYPNLL